MNRGDIYTITLKKGVSSELYGRRFAVVLQSNSMLPRSVVIIAPTSQSALDASIRPNIEVQQQPTKVMVEQMKAVSVERLGKKVGRVAAEEQWMIDDALFALLGLN
jgi:mRNA interferase MazF